MRSGQITAIEAAGSRTPFPVTLGAYQRVIKQGRVNLQKSIVSVLLSAKLGLIKAEEFKKLLEIVLGSPGELNDEQAHAFVTLVLSLSNKIVM
ncbi:MAG: hypothetical protein OK422_03285 [Thaumarchaeota archaeon]|nr:hypothetical protein [Nitrososphaerota archaeon]